jgi:hypothetical protein
VVDVVADEEAEAEEEGVEMRGFGLDVVAVAVEVEIEVEEEVARGGDESFTEDERGGGVLRVETDKVGEVEEEEAVEVTGLDTVEEEEEDDEDVEEEEDEDEDEKVVIEGFKGRGGYK